MSEGVHDKEIAHRLGITRASVKTTIQTAKAKVQVGTRVQLGIWWDRKFREGHRIPME